MLEFGHGVHAGAQEVDTLLAEENPETLVVGNGHRAKLIGFIGLLAEFLLLGVFLVHEELGSGLDLGAAFDGEEQTPGLEHDPFFVRVLSLNTLLLRAVPRIASC